VQQDIDTEGQIWRFTARATRYEFMLKEVNTGFLQKGILMSGFQFSQVISFRALLEKNKAKKYILNFI